MLRFALRVRERLLDCSQLDYPLYFPASRTGRSL
jgi:hypothetical protein